MPDPCDAAFGAEASSASWPPRNGRESSKARVLVREPIADAGVELLRSRFDVDVDGESDLAETIGGYDAIVVRSATKLTADLIARAERLKVIGRAGVGVDNVDVAAATRRGIVVANAPESTVISAAEHTVGLLLALSRNIPQAHAALKEGRWERKRWGGIELADKTLGVLGFGRIGQQVARRALGLSMRVVAYDPFVSADRFRELGVERAETPDDVLAAAGFLTLHLPLTDETRGFVSREAIAKMRDGVRIVNAARGALVDEEALAEALRSGKVAAAGLDVFSAEPYSGALLELDNVVVTPHLAASTEEAQDRAGVIVAEQVAAALAGELVSNAVNIPVIGADDLEVLGPYIPLASKLGRLAMELADGRASRIELAYYGGLAAYDTRLLTVAALNGAFQGRSDTPVNYVNAPLVAEERGIDGRRAAPLGLARLHEPDPRHRDRRRPRAARRRHDDRPREPAVARERARLRARARAHAAARPLPLRRRAGRDRARRHAVRRGRREHREHGRLAHEAGRQGADGALDRLAGAAGARRAPSRGRLRRRAFRFFAVTYSAAQTVFGERFPEYEAYRRGVCYRLVPLLY